MTDLNITVDQVNHPTHYTAHPSGIEAIEITRHMNFNLGNAIKYIWRAGLKNQDKHIEDLKKAVFYLNDEIKRLEGLKFVNNMPNVERDVHGVAVSPLTPYGEDLLRHQREKHTLEDMYRPDCRACN